MNKLRVSDRPIAANVCEQVLREIERQPTWTLAHVIMNPFAQSLLHLHRRMTEIYVITRGYGDLLIGQYHYRVTAGSVLEIPVGVPHMLINKGAGQLEHLVFAFPPFDPSDVEMVEQELVEDWYDLDLPKEVECFDGAKIIPYDFPHLDLSIAFGRVINAADRRKETHFHKKTAEWIYIAEGEGKIKLDDTTMPVFAGDWITIPPGMRHALANFIPEDMVVVCVCSPAFDKNDVHY